MTTTIVVLLFLIVILGLFYSSLKKPRPTPRTITLSNSDGTLRRECALGDRVFVKRVEGKYEPLPAHWGDGTEATIAGIHDHDYLVIEVLEPGLRNRQPLPVRKIVHRAQVTFTAATVVELMPRLRKTE